ncbi:MAG: hypothetical protein ACLTWK_12215 [Eisenbergiella sp.]
MYTIIKNVILSGNFQLSDMQNKIDTLWAESKITDEQRTELIALMKEHLDPSTQAPEQVELYKRLEAKYAELEARVAKLENGGAEPMPPAPTAVPNWEPWDGISNKYQYGSVVTHNSKYYISPLQSQNTWEPGSFGVDENIWKEISKENAEAVVNGTKTPEEVIGAPGI